MVIPVSHSSELYDEGNPCKGKAIIMSLKYMRYDDPDNGGDLQKMCWGFNNYYYNQDENPDSPVHAVMSMGAVDNLNKNEYLNGHIAIGYAPCSYLPGTRCVRNRRLFYYNSPYYPTPYNEDLSFNANYKSALFFDKFGKEVTNAIVNAQCTVDWQNGPINNSFEQGNYPAFCCCLRYRTPGTSPGDWWFPSIGEVMYMIPFAEDINYSISILNAIYEDGAYYPLDLQPGAFSSCSPSNAYENCWGYGPNDCNVAPIPRKSNYKIRAFCAV